MNTIEYDTQNPLPLAEAIAAMASTVAGLPSLLNNAAVEFAEDGEYAPTFLRSLAQEATRLAMMAQLAADAVEAGFSDDEAPEPVLAALKTRPGSRSRAA